MLRFRQKREEGDTLIEVIFATATLSLVIVISLIVMNQGQASSERAVEGTFVRQAIDSQAEMLRFARDSFIDGSSPATWTDIVANHRTPTVTSFDDLATLPSCKPISSKAFYLSTTGSGVTISSTLASPSTFAMPGHGLWVEAPSASSGYVDFYIYGCWESPTQGPNATSGTVVRLYAPTS